MNSDTENKMEGIIGLDDDMPEYIYVYHESHPTIKSRLVVGTTMRNLHTPISGFISTIISNDSTIINNEVGIPLRSVRSQNTNIKNITDEEELEAFLFVVKYIERYSETPEWSGFKIPATEANIKYWLDDSTESELFGVYRDINIHTESTPALIRKLSILLSFANYLGMVGLVDKCCYLIAYAITGKTPDQVDKIMNY